MPLDSNGKGVLRQLEAFDESVFGTRGYSGTRSRLADSLVVH